MNSRPSKRIWLNVRISKRLENWTFAASRVKLHGVDSPYDQIRFTPIRSPEVLGRLVRMARKSRGLTQEQLAARVGRRRQAIIAQEAGVSTAALRCLFDSLAVLGYEMSIAPRGTTRGAGPLA